MAEAVKETAQNVKEQAESAVQTAKEKVGLGGGSDGSSSSIIPSLREGGSRFASTGGPSIQATREEMSAARLPLAYRDSCAHLLIPLNKCRFQNYYLPWRCEDERHSYEKCQYEEFKLRVKKMDEIREAKGGARSN